LNGFSQNSIAAATKAARAAPVSVYRFAAPYSRPTVVKSMRVNARGAALGFHSRCRYLKIDITGARARGSTLFVGGFLRQQPCERGDERHRDPLIAPIESLDGEI
jgi:hypothetical protein